jgi:carbamoyltransferase
VRILGICHDVWICSAAVVEDGRVVSAIAEERLDRKKLSRVFPSMAISRCLADANLTLGEIDEIAVAWNPSIEMETTPSGYLTSRRWRSEHIMQVPAQIMRLAGASPSRALTIGSAFEDAPPITFVNHYDAHIGAGYFLSDYDEAAILVLDGRGEKQTGMLGYARGAEIETIREIRFPHSLGLFYGAVTQYLGFTPDSDEWKVMALGSYADPHNQYLGPLSELVTVRSDGTFELALEHFEHYNHWDRRLFSDKFVDAFGKPRIRGDELTTRHYEIAAATQAVFETSVSEIMTILHAQTGASRASVSGGCFMNSVFNGKATQLTPFTEVHVSSCPDDSGTSVGAAIFLEATRSGRKPEGGAVRHNYWGPEFNDDTALASVQRYRLPNAEPVADPAARAAQDLVDGKIVGWFQGRMEFGQRALGGRSILIDPRRPDGKETVNAAVKYRESFRPFAPAILAERVHEYFDCPAGTLVPFMERVLPFRDDRRQDVPAVVHVDGTGRLQTVEADVSPRFHALISEFDKRTGVPLVLNTSFNLNGEPIVCSPEDAIRTFYSCGLDVLYLNNVRITKS